jgi:hypothetical protein
MEYAKVNKSEIEINFNVGDDSGIVHSEWLNTYTETPIKYYHTVAFRCGINKI